MHISDEIVQREVNQHLGKKATKQEIQRAIEGYIICEQIAEHIEATRRFNSKQQEDIT